MKNLIPFAIVLTCLSFATVIADDSKPTNIQGKQSMDLGNFSVSLAVKDIAASKKFYETLGFEIVGGVEAQNWLVLRNGPARVGLFQGMFDKNIMTFNPGWSTDAERLDEFTDIREIQKHLKRNGIELSTEADESTKGPASLTLSDPDGNLILIDQHVE